MVHLLRAYADKFDGKFPKDPSVAGVDWQTYIKQRWGDEKPKGLPEPKVMQFMRRLIRIEMLLRRNKDHGYKADDVKLGDRDKIVFWYRPDKADKYRAVFGDLHVADVTRRSAAGETEEMIRPVCSDREGPALVPRSLLTIGFAFALSNHRPIWNHCGRNATYFRRSSHTSAQDEIASAPRTETPRSIRPTRSACAGDDLQVVRSRPTSHHRQGTRRPSLAR